MARLVRRGRPLLRGRRRRGFRPPGVSVPWGGAAPGRAGDPPVAAGDVFALRVFRFFGEALRQAGLLILTSTLVIWGLIFIIGLQCGIEGAYFNRAVGSPAYAGVFAAWCDLRELV